MPTDKLQILTPIVTSVNGQTGDVTLTANDVDAIDKYNGMTPVECVFPPLFDGDSETSKTLYVKQGVINPVDYKTVTDDIKTAWRNLTFLTDATVGKLSSYQSNIKGIAPLIEIGVFGEDFFNTVTYNSPCVFFDDPITQRKKITIYTYNASKKSFSVIVDGPNGFYATDAYSILNDEFSGGRVYDQHLHPYSNNANDTNSKLGQLEMEAAPTKDMQIATKKYVDDSVSNPLNITSATVGQIAKISTVDDTGKPTTWETVDMHTPFKPEGKSYLTFSSPNSFTLAVNDTTKHWDGTLEYFASDKTWTTWDGTTTLSAVAYDGEYVLYLRGTGNTVITGSRSNYKWVLTGTDISCIGNIENLLDYETVQSGVYPTMATNCYRNMFRDCTSLTQAPELPATTLASDCYYCMFYGCTYLTQAPALPATTLVDGCYYSMFYGCTSLTQAPALPATTLADYCYSQMFCGCTSLTQAPALPVITLANQCYDGMFAGCTSLTKAPALPATTLANNCYHFMFLNCTSLTQVPALPATTLANQCYNGMFSGCTSLKLSSTQTGEYTQEYRIPTIGTGTTATDALTDMFTSTSGTFTGTPEINTTYYLSSDNMIVHETEIATLREYVESMIDSPFKPEGKSYLTFSSPNSFTLAVGNATKHWDGTLEYFASNKTWTTWDGTTTLFSVENDGEHFLYLRGTGNTVITGNKSNYRWLLTGSDIKCIGNIENLLDYATVEAGNHPTIANYCYNQMFFGCTSLTHAPDLPTTTLANSCYAYMFKGCKSLTQAPALPATTLANQCYSSMFQDCTTLTQPPALPATTLANQCYSYMFRGCTALIQVPELPATTLANYCYYYMFQGCTSLTKAPALQATTLADYCYEYMFADCTSLTQVPALPATTLKFRCYYNMFNGCTKIKLSSTQTDEYTQKYRIPSSGTGTTTTNALSNMFTNTGGTFTGTPSINTTYYLSSDNMVVYDTEVATLREYVGSMIDVAIGNAIGGSY